MLQSMGCHKGTKEVIHKCKASQAARVVRHTAAASLCFTSQADSLHRLWTTMYMAVTYCKIFRSLENCCCFARHRGPQLILITAKCLSRFCTIMQAVKALSRASGTPLTLERKKERPTPLGLSLGVLQCLKPYTGCLLAIRSVTSKVSVLHLRLMRPLVMSAARGVAPEWEP